MKLAKLMTSAGMLLALGLASTPVLAQDLSAPPPTVLLIDQGGDLPTRPLAVQSPQDFVRSHPLTIDEFTAQYYPNDPARARVEFDRLRGQTRPICQDAIAGIGETYVLLGLFRGSAQDFADLRAEIPELVRNQNRATGVRRGSLIGGSILNPFSIPGNIGYEATSTASDGLMLFSIDVHDANIGLTEAVIRAQLNSQRAQYWWWRIAHNYCVGAYGVQGEPLPMIDPSMFEYPDTGTDRRVDRDDRRDRYERDDRYGERDRYDRRDERRERYDRRDRRDDRSRWPSGRQRGG